MVQVASQHSGVGIGSYPNTRDESYKVKVVLTSRDGAALEAAADAVRAAVPAAAFSTALP